MDALARNWWLIAFGLAEDEINIFNIAPINVYRFTHMCENIICYYFTILNITEANIAICERKFISMNLKKLQAEPVAVQEWATKTGQR